jgi:hypothetical protein
MLEVKLFCIQLKKLPSIQFVTVLIIKLYIYLFIFIFLLKQCVVTTQTLDRNFHERKKKILFFLSWLCWKICPGFREKNKHHDEMLTNHLDWIRWVNWKVQNFPLARVLSLSLIYKFTKNNNNLEFWSFDWRELLAFMLRLSKISNQKNKLAR